MRVSSTATTPASSTSLASRLTTATPRAAGVRTTATPQGTKRLPSSEKKISSFSAAAHSMRAR